MELLHSSIWQKNNNFHLLFLLIKKILDKLTKSVESSDKGTLQTCLVIRQLNKEFNQLLLQLRAYLFRLRQNMSIV